MGDVRPVESAVLVAGVLYRDDAVLSEAERLMADTFGPIALAGRPFDFIMTDYYTDEMGAGLTKKFIAFERLILPDFLPRAKHETNKIENVLGRAADGRFRRTVNIDPGYVTLAKLVLASTKDYSHRLYIGDSIYAEVTLRYEKQTFYVIDTTYPDYQTPLAIDFFNAVREYLKQARRT